MSAPDGGASAATGARARTATRAAGPALGPSPRTGPRSRARRRSGCRPGRRDRRGRRPARRQGAVVVRRRGQRLRRPPRRRARGLPFETWLLDRVIAHAAGQPVVEVGSGPGHVTAYLADGGADATGIDLSPDDGDRGPPTFPRAELRGRRPAAADPPTPRAPGGRPFWGGTRSSTWPPPSCPTRSRRWPAPLPPAGGWSSACMPEPRSATSTSGSATRSTSTSCCTSRRSWSAIVEAAGLVDIEWYLRGPLTAMGETTRRLYVVGRKAS